MAPQISANSLASFAHFSACKKSIFLTIIVSALLILQVGSQRAFAEKERQPPADRNNQPIETTSAPYLALFTELEQQHGFTRRELERLFSGVTIDGQVLERMEKKAEAMPYFKYRSLFVKPEQIAEGKKHLKDNTELFDRIENQYGVDREAVVAIWAVESRYGKYQGNFEIFRTLNTLFAAYPQRSDFFRKELVQFLILCRDNDMDPRNIHGSYAGAMGQAQFMPSSYLAYSVDFDGDGKRDLLNSRPDIFASIANYLHNFGWKLHTPLYREIGDVLRDPALLEVAKNGRKGRVHWRQLSGIQQITIPQPPGDGIMAIIELENAPADGGGVHYVAAYPNFLAITEYNHSPKYAMAVSEMIENFKD